MKKILFILTCMAAMTTSPQHLQAQTTTAAADDSLFVLKTDGSIDIFPEALLQKKMEVAGNLKLTTTAGHIFRYPLDEIESYDHHLDVRRPTITSFKFNNKFNHQVFSDILCDISDDNTISAQMACIGHWLTPSFQRSDKRAEVWLDGTEPLVSKHSRLKFGNSHTLTVAYPGMRVLKSVKVGEGTPGSTTVEMTPIAVTADMLSTNAPSNNPNAEGLQMLVDDNPSTFFHSTWGTGTYEKLPEDKAPYIDVTLPDAVHNLVYAMTNRADTEARSPQYITLYASEDGSTWQAVHVFSTDNGFSTDKGATNTSPVIALETPVNHLRFEMTKGVYKNYFCLAELKLYEATVHTEGATDDTYEEQLMPFGTEYQLQLEWLTPKVPRVDIQVEYNEYPSSRDYYLFGNITIDGQGFYPSMTTTDMNIKGRGNSSWSSNSYSKNPYRLKFNQKVKPFGLTGGKSWVLLSNRQTGSMTSNAIGMYAAGLIGVDGANHIVPVELYMNGKYWGSYNFTEKTGLSNNSIDLADETKACFIELDTYTDETIYRSKPYSLPVKIKEPDFTDPSSTELTSKDDIMTRFNAFMLLIRDGGDITTEVDIESMARYLVADELILNYELMHPKSTFLYHENLLEDTCKWKWGPIWDLDWGFGYQNSHSYYLGGATDDYWTGTSMEASTFMKRLRYSGEPLDRAMYKYWTRFMRLHLEELIDYCDEYYALARPSLENNNNQVHGSNRDNTNYATSTENAKAWLRRRAIAVYAQQTPYDLTEEEITGVAPDDGDTTDDSPFYTDGIIRTVDAEYFDVYDLRGVKLKSGASFNEWRNGLKPGIYIVNGRKVLVR